MKDDELKIIIEANEMVQSANKAMSEMMQKKKKKGTYFFIISNNSSISAITAKTILAMVEYFNWRLVVS